MSLAGHGMGRRPRNSYWTCHPGSQQYIGNPRPRCPATTPLQKPGMHSFPGSPTKVDRIRGWRPPADPAPGIGSAFRDQQSRAAAMPGWKYPPASRHRVARRKQLSPRQWTRPRAPIQPGRPAARGLDLLLQPGKIDVPTGKSALLLPVPCQLMVQPPDCMPILSAPGPVTR